MVGATADGEALRWAAEAAERLREADSFEDYEEPEPPDSVVRERRERRGAEMARARQRRRGEVEDVPFEERCMGMGPVCVHCGDELPPAGKAPRRCPEVGGGG